MRLPSQFLGELKHGPGVATANERRVPPCIGLQESEEPLAYADSLIGSQEGAPATTKQQESPPESGRSPPVRGSS